jgi:hypothetical protein
MTTAIANPTRLTVVGDSGKRDASGKCRRYLVCRCSCGSEVEIPKENVLSGKTLSCGCLSREIARASFTKHGLYRTRARKIWAGMKERCQNPNNDAYPGYGGRGITLSPLWQEFAPFYEYLLTLLPDGVRDIPKGLSVDRINNNLGYQPGNVRLANMVEQNRNRRGNRLIEIDGVSKCLAEWCEIHGKKQPVVWKRLRRGWDINRALTTPAKT